MAIYDNHIVNNIIPTMPKIQVQSGKGLFNARCHQNAVQKAMKDGEGSIAAVLCVQKGKNPYVFIHYVNRKVNSSGSIKYTDNTLGVFSDENDYYLYETVVKRDFLTITDHFVGLRKRIYKRLPFYKRWFCNDYDI